MITSHNNYNCGCDANAVKKKDAKKEKALETVVPDLETRRDETQNAAAVDEAGGTSHFSATRKTN